MKREYISPEISVTMFEPEDIITTSSIVSLGKGDDGSGTYLFDQLFGSN